MRVSKRSLQKHLLCVLAVLSIAFLPLYGSAADAPDAPVPGMVDSTVNVQAQSDALSDVPQNSWAYEAIQDLVRDGIVVGYPDGTFKGDRPLTRYEAAVLTERAVQYLSKQLANPQTAAQVTQADIDTLRKLLAEFKGDIEALKMQVNDIDSRLKTVEAQQAALTATQNRAQIGLRIWERAGNFRDAVSAYNGDGRALLPNVPLVVTGGQTQVGSGGAVSANRYLSGLNDNGYGYQVARLYLDGNVDSNLSYHLRLENVYNWDTSDAFQTGGITGATTASGSGLSTVSTSAAGGAATTSPNFTGGSYPRNTTVRFNYGYVSYQDPRGYFASVGRVDELDGTLGLVWNDQFNGAEIGFKKGSVNIRGGYFFDYPALNNVAGYTSGTTAAACRGINNPAPLTPAGSSAITTTEGAAPCGVTSQTFLASAQFQPVKHVMIGAAYADDVNAVISSWNPAVCYNGAAQCSPAAMAAACAPGAATCSPYGLYQPAVVNIAVGSIYGQYLNPDLFAKGMGLSFEGEGLIRFGNDPFTHATWQQNTSYWLQGKIGAVTAKRGAAYLEGGWISSGLNSTDEHTGIEGSTFYESQFLGNPNGYQIGYAGVHYWFSKFGRIGLLYNYYDLRSGTTYPVGSATCPGCYLTHDTSRALFLQTYLQF